MARPNPKTQKGRMSADETRRALVAACVKLLKRGGPAAVSVRDVAAEAGVNHGLVHRYFGAKEALIEAAIRQISDEVHRGSPSGAMSASTFAYLRAHPEVARLVARACLDGPPELLALAAPDRARLAEIIRPIEAALARAGLDDVDAHLLNGFASAALLGWFLFKPLLRRGFGLPSDADDQLARLLSMIDALVVPPAGAGG